MSTWYQPHSQTRRPEVGHALDLYRRLDHPVPEADALIAVGSSPARLGGYDAAQAHCGTALTRCRRSTTPRARTAP